MADDGGQIIVADSCFEFVKKYFIATKITKPETNESFHLVDYKTQLSRVKIVSDTMKMQ